MLKKVHNESARSGAEATTRAATTFVDLATAVASIADGSRVAISKIEPMDAARALALSGRRDLALVAVPTAGFAADLLVAVGAVGSIETGAITLPGHGGSPAASRALAEKRLRRIESACPLLELQIQAGALGLPFTPVPHVLGSEVVSSRDDLRVIDDPFGSGDRIVVAPALRPDVALIHGLRADFDGNVVVSALGEDRLLARAAHVTIVTVEEIRADATARTADDEIVVPSIFVTAIAPAPGGTWPVADARGDGADAAGIAAHLAASRSATPATAHLALAAERLEATHRRPR